MASWIEEDHPGELAFTIVQAGVVSLSTQDRVVEQAYADARNDRHEFGSDWTNVYVRVPGRDNLDFASLVIQDRRADGDSGGMVPTLVVTNLVTHKEHLFGLG